MGHWGAVDGRNTWQDYDTAVILGLPYLPQTWATNMFCALQGAQDDKWLQSPEWKQFKNVRKEMEQRQMSVSVIQAINRICCRHVIDAEGHCPPADIFIVLPRMPWVTQCSMTSKRTCRVSAWSLGFRSRPREGEEASCRQLSRAADRLRSEAGAGTVSLSTIQHDLQLSSVKKLRETLNDNDHPTTQALRDMGVSYIPGVGRGSKSYLMKAA